MTNICYQCAGYFIYLHLNYFTWAMLHFLLHMPTLANRAVAAPTSAEMGSRTARTVVGSALGGRQATGSRRWTASLAENQTQRCSAWKLTNTVKYQHFYWFHFSIPHGVRKAWSYLAKCSCNIKPPTWTVFVDCLCQSAGKWREKSSLTCAMGSRIAMPFGAANPHVESAALNAYTFVFFGQKLCGVCVLVVFRRQNWTCMRVPSDSPQKWYQYFWGPHRPLINWWITLGKCD